MAYRIESLHFYVRETKPARFASALGKAAVQGGGARVTSPLCHVRMVVRGDQGRTTFGCAADRLSVRWLDKRPGRSKSRKLRELVALIQHAGGMYRAAPQFETAFGKWLEHHPRIMEEGRRRDQESLTALFVSALLERALLDAVCRLDDRPLYQAIHAPQIGFQPGRVHPELDGAALRQVLRPPRTTLRIRHTIGFLDPLTREDWPDEKRLDDGLPETVQEYIERDGIHYFKIKISGDPERDLRRLARIWEIMPQERQPVLTLDANEAYDDLERFAGFVRRLEREQLGLFQHIRFVEQPLPRRLALDPSAGRWIRRIGRIKPVIIDESDGTLDAFKRAYALGYAGTSHKNCKGVFKSLMNLLLMARFAADGRPLVFSGEDLQNLPIVPLHQDFVTVGLLGLEHCERNGHHYNFGLSMLSEKDRASVARNHRDLYVQRRGEWFLNIRDGAVETTSLHRCAGFGVCEEPDWNSMEDLETWVRKRAS